MNETIDQLKAAHAEHLASLEAANTKLDDESLSGDEFKEWKAKFGEAEAKLDETAEKIKAANASHERSREREDIRKATEVRRQDAAKLEETFLRRPNQKGAVQKSKSQIEAELGSTNFVQDIQMSMAAWASYSPENRDFTSEQVAALQKTGINFADPRLNLNRDGALREWARNAYGRYRSHGEYAQPMAGATDPADTRDGQFSGLLARPPFQIAALAENSYSTNGIMKAPVRVMDTDHGDDIEETYINDMANVGRHIGEGQNIQSTKTPPVGKIRWGANKYTSDSLEYSWEMLKKSRWDLPERVPGYLGGRLGRATGLAFTTGSGGAGYPQGIITAAQLGGLVSATKVANVISPDDIRYMAANSVDYTLLDENPTAVGWMMGRATWNYISTTRDGQGRPYFEMSYEMVNGRRVNMLEGYPIFINYDFPAVSFVAGVSQTGTNMLLFGNFSKFVVRYAYGSLVPVLIRDDVSGISSMKTNFTAVQWVDSRVEDYGNPPFALLQSA